MNEHLKVFKRLETDLEFRGRCRAAGLRVFDYMTSRELEDYAWVVQKMQRRIIEVCA